MSWYIKSIGTRAAVKAAVLKTPNVPEGIKTSVVAILDEPGNGNGAVNPSIPHTHARVEGHGHSGGGYGSIGKLETELFSLEPEPAPAA